MNSAARRYLDLLEEEREAARRADVERLVLVQEHKRAMLEPLRAAALAPAEVERIVVRSRANLRLLRHLSECLRALGHVEATGGAGGYDARGRRAFAAEGHVP